MQRNSFGDSQNNMRKSERKPENAQSKNAHSTNTADLVLFDNGRSLLECKLRRYIYLGEQFSIYVSPLFREHYWKKDSHRYDVICIQIIGKIVKNNNLEAINSVVPLLLKISKANPLNCDQHMIFALAVCAKFDLIQCSQMVHDAYAAVKSVCENGLQLLMFVKYCYIAAKMLYDQGYLPRISKTTGRGFKKAMCNWYLSRDPFYTIQLILQNKHFQGVTHKHVMIAAQVTSDDPLQRIMIKHTMGSFDDVKEYYKLRMQGFHRFVNKDRPQLEALKYLINYIYKYLKLFNRAYKIDQKKFIYFILYNSCMAKVFNAISDPNLNNIEILSSLIYHMPLRTLIDYTNTLAKRGLFKKNNGDINSLKFINRFNNMFQLKESQIHPIEPCVEYLKYIKTGEMISYIVRSKDPSSWTFFINKRVLDYSSSEENTNEELLKSNNNVQMVNLNHKKIRKFMKPIPKLSPELINFLSNDLIQKSFYNIKSTGLRTLIAYDSQQFVKMHIAKFGHEKSIYICEAITMIILSLVYPEKDKEQKPFLYRLNTTEKRFSSIYIDYDQSLTFEYLIKLLFKEFGCVEKDHLTKKKYNEHFEVYPLAIMNSAIKREEIFDVFVFLGTNKMDFKHIREIKKKYMQFSGKRVKIIVCCLNGNHKYQNHLSREGMLFIPGFDKNIGRIIQSFIRDEF